MSIFDRAPWLKPVSVVAGLGVAGAMVAVMFMGAPKEEITQIELPLSTPQSSRDGASAHPYSPENKPEIWVRETPLYIPSVQSTQDNKDEALSDLGEGVGFTVCAVATPWEKVVGYYSPMEFVSSESIFWFGVGTPPTTRDDGKPVSLAFQDLNGDGILQSNETVGVGEFLTDTDRPVLARKRSDGSWMSFTSSRYDFSDFGKGLEGDIILQMRQESADWEIDLKLLDSGC